VAEFTSPSTPPYCPPLFYSPRQPPPFPKASDPPGTPPTLSTPNSDGTLPSCQIDRHHFPTLSAIFTLCNPYFVSSASLLSRVFFAACHCAPQRFCSLYPARERPHTTLAVIFHLDRRLIRLPPNSWFFAFLPLLPQHYPVFAP